MNNENIKIVLVNTSHPGNIGSAARAMKTMGLNQLCLVSPEIYPDEKATALAAGAVDVLEKATVFSCLKEAIADCQLVVASSARDRSLPWPMLSPREMGKQIVAESAQAKVAIVFGCERSGLTNEELQQAHFHVHIPGSAEYSVLNLAAAVQVLCYEVRQAMLEGVAPGEALEEKATQEALEHLYDHFETLLKEIGFIAPKQPQQSMTKLRRLFTRARPEVLEVKMLRGILSSIQKSGLVDK